MTQASWDNVSFTHATGKQGMQCQCREHPGRRMPLGNGVRTEVRIDQHHTGGRDQQLPAAPATKASRMLRAGFARRQRRSIPAHQRQSLEQQLRTLWQLFEPVGCTLLQALENAARRIALADPLFEKGFAFAHRSSSG